MNWKVNFHSIYHPSKWSCILLIDCMADTFKIDVPPFKRLCTTDRNAGEVDRSRTRLWLDRTDGRGDGSGDLVRIAATDAIRRTVPRTTTDLAAGEPRRTQPRTCERAPREFHVPLPSRGGGQTIRGLSVPSCGCMGSPNATFLLAGHVSLVHLLPALGFMGDTPADAPHTCFPGRLVSPVPSGADVRGVSDETKGASGRSHPRKRPRRTFLPPL